MKTLAELKATVIADLDLYDEDFANTEDLNRWVNDGIRIAETSIHLIYQDYFLSMVEAPIVSSSIDYPSDIYANKIRSIMISDAGSVYEIKKSRSIKKDIMYEMLEVPSTTNETLRWFPMNDATNGRKIRFTPADSASGVAKILYIRNAKILVNEDDVCDIDEFERFIEQHVKTQAYLKDGDPRAADSAQLEGLYKNDMVSTLKDMAADNDNEMDFDMSFYQECV